MEPIFSTPWDSFVLVLPKFNIDGVEGVYISVDDIQKHINRLKAAGTIRRVGGDYGGYWEVFK